MSLELWIVVLTSCLRSLETTHRRDGVIVLLTSATDKTTAYRLALVPFLQRVHTLAAEHVRAVSLIRLRSFYHVLRQLEALAKCSTLNYVVTHAHVCEIGVGCIHE
jgi:hypothetical protein